LEIPLLPIFFIKQILMKYCPPKYEKSYTKENYN
jgi:hypothetical protein